MTQRIASAALGLCLISALAISGCNKPKSEAKPDAVEEKDTVGDVDIEEKKTDDPGASLDATIPGVVPSTAATVTMVGTLAVAPALTSGADYDTVMAVPIRDGRFEVDSAIRSTLDDKGAFKLELPRGSTELDEYKGLLNADGTVNQEARAKFNVSHPGSESYSDELFAQNITEGLEEMAADPHKGEKSYVIVSLKANSDRVAEAQSFRFIGLSTGSGPLIQFPAKAAKGDMSLGKITASGEDAVAELAADSTSFDIAADVIAQMATTSNALKAVKNAYMNTDVSNNRSYIPTPYFTWAARIDASAGAYNDVAHNTYTGFSSYIGVNNSELTLAELCQADENQRTILSVFPPVDLTINDPGSHQPVTYGPTAPRTSAGTLSKALASENGGDRQNCGAGNAYIAGNQYNAGHLEQLGLIGDYPDIHPPEGLWLLKKGTETIAHFDLAVTDPRDADGTPRVFIPSVSYDVDPITKKITAYHIKFYAWNRVTLAYEQLVSTDAFDRIRNEFGFDGMHYDNNGGVTGGTREFKAVDGVVTITALKNDAGDPVELYGAGGPTNSVLNKIFIYYRAFGNSYNFFWTDNGLL